MKEWRKLKPGEKVEKGEEKTVIVDWDGNKTTWVRTKIEKIEVWKQSEQS